MSTEPQETQGERIAQGIEGEVKAEMAQGAGIEEGETWEEMAHRLEGKIRREIAGLLGGGPEASWSEIGQGLESRTKEAFGGWAGATPADDWEAVGRKIESRIRANAARWSGAEAGQEADWDDIGHRVEQRVRGRLGSWAGAEPGASWGEVGRSYEARIRSELSQRPGKPQRGQAPAAGPGVEEGATMAEAERQGERVTQEEIHVSGSELVDRFKQLLREGNIRRVIIKQGDRVIAEFPLTVGIVGAILAPTLAAVGAIAALAADYTIVVERAA